MYDPSVPLEDWFIEALKEARHLFKRGEHATSKELNFEMAVPDDTSIRAESLEAATIIIAAFTDREHSLLTDLMGGASWREVIRTHHASSQEVGHVTRKLAHLRELLPERRSLQRVVRRSTADVSMAEPEIDRQIAQLDLPPPIGKECPPCFRCRWFDGFLSATYEPKSTVEEPEIQQAIWNTEAAKLRIAAEIQAGFFR